LLLGASLPAFVLGDAYRHFLARVVELVYAPFGVQLSLTSLDILAPVDLALYAALCLAPANVPRSRRLWTLVGGAGVLIALEVALAAWMVWLAHESSMGRDPAAPLVSLRAGVMASFTWAAPLAIWWAWLGGASRQLFSSDVGSPRPRGKRPREHRTASHR
jgi:hypothetical protein